MTISTTCYRKIVCYILKVFFESWKRSNKSLINNFLLQSWILHDMVYSGYLVFSTLRSPIPLYFWDIAPLCSVTKAKKILRKQSTNWGSNPQPSRLQLYTCAPAPRLASEFTYKIASYVYVKNIFLTFKYNKHIRL